MHESELSSKMVPKAYPGEKVGVFCQKQGKKLVVEYSDLPADLTNATGPDGELRFRAGSIAIHLFNREFIDRLGSGDDEGARPPLPPRHKKFPLSMPRGSVTNPPNRTATSSRCSSSTPSLRAESRHHRDRARRRLFPR